MSNAFQSSSKIPNLQREKAFSSSLCIHLVHFEMRLGNRRPSVVGGNISFKNFPISYICGAEERKYTKYDTGMSFEYFLCRYYYYVL